MTTPETAASPSEFAKSLRRGALIGSAVLLLVLPPAIHFAPRFMGREAPPAQSQVHRFPRSQVHLHRLADLRGQAASPDVRRMADWVADSGDNGTRAFVIIDKPRARVYLFGPDARLRTAASALLGAAHGDDTAPGVGEEPIDDVKPADRTTPAGRFIAQVGESASRREDVVWVDYGAAVSMHRVIKVPERLKALAASDAAAKRMSYGCINLPDAFYEGYLRPAIDGHGLVVYILPETRPIEQTFVSFYDVHDPAALAQH